MTISRSKDALHDYFQELLDTGPDDAAEEAEERSMATAIPKPKPENANSDTSQSFSHVARDHRQKAPTEHLVQAKAVSRETPAAPEQKLQSREALREEQKKKLQALLSQQTLQQNKTDLKTDLKVEEKTEAKAEVNVEVGEPLVHDIQHGTEIETELAAPETEVYDRFHSAEAHTVEWAENGRPLWAQSEFDALLFDVGGLTLAVPLVSLGQIVPLDKDALTPIFGQSDWFMGMLPSNLGKLRVVNTALFVMPEKYDSNFVDNAEYAISLDGVPWALAVNKVNQPIRLNPTDIKWRSERSKRPWLAGTVKTAMCALLDIPKMGQLLNQSDKQLSSPSA